MEVQKGNRIIVQRKIHPDDAIENVMNVIQISTHQCMNQVSNLQPGLTRHKASSSVQTSGTTLLHRQKEKVNQFKRMTRLVLIILLLNTLTLIPYILFYTLYKFDVKGAEFGIQISAVMSMINSSCNVFKYIACDKMFRQ
jgi:hypothetical protein